MGVRLLKSVFVTLAAWVVLATPVAAFEPIDPAKKKDIKQMLEVSGTLEGLRQMRPIMMQSYMQIMKAAYKDEAVPAAFCDELGETLITEADLASLIEDILPVYDNNFTHQEIQDLIATFDSPAYSKWVKKLPTMMQESSAIGREWGRRFGQSGVIKERIKILLMKYEMDDAPLERPALR